MSEMRFNPQQYDVLDSMRLPMPGVKRGQAFSQPAHYNRQDESLLQQTFEYVSQLAT